MNKSEWASLQNGSDIRGIATEGVVGESVNLTPLIVEKIALAFVSWLTQKKNLTADKLTIAIGRDSRISGPTLMEAFIKGILSTGANSVCCGITSTPAMYMSTIFENTRYDGAVMLTASHLPYNRNGIKFFTSDGGLEKNDITRILELAASNAKYVGKKPGTASHFDLISVYSQFLVTTIRQKVNDPRHFNTPLRGFHIVVDAGNGSGGFFVDKVLQPLGA
ncbi:MAG: phosphomannomutase/phosphoglucomutase, partial [Bacteroidota bacterium]|nr:phosphomannomutase/phosphoglucomutase [Bacteroidota bacterium]